MSAPQENAKPTANDTPSAVNNANNAGSSPNNVANHDNNDNANNNNANNNSESNANNNGGSANAAGSGAAANKPARKVYNATEKLPPAQLWRMLILSDVSRKLLGERARELRHLARKIDPQPEDNTRGRCDQFTENNLREHRHNDSEEKQFPIWMMSPHDRIHRWLQGARTPEMMLIIRGISCEECMPFIEKLREMRNRAFGSWLVCAKIDLAWVPALIPFDGHCMYSLRLRDEVEVIFSYLIPETLQRGEYGRANRNRQALVQQQQEFNSSNPNAPLSTSAPVDPRQQPERFADAVNVLWLLRQAIIYVYPMINEKTAEIVSREMLELVLPYCYKLRSIRQITTTSPEANADPANACGNAGGDNPVTVTEVKEMLLVGFPLFAAMLTVVIESWSFNEHDAADMVKLALRDRMLLQQIKLQRIRDRVVAHDHRLRPNMKWELVPSTSSANNFNTSSNPGGNSQSSGSPTMPEGQKASGGDGSLSQVRPIQGTMGAGGIVGGVIGVGIQPPRATNNSAAEDAANNNNSIHSLPRAHYQQSVPMDVSVLTTHGDNNNSSQNAVQ